MTPESAEYTKQHLAELKSQVKRVALVGITGLKTIIVKGIGREAGSFQEIFDTQEEAKEWLVS